MNINQCSNQEIHVLFEHGCELENTSNEPRVICMMLYMEKVVDQTDHSANAFVREHVAYCYDIMTMLRHSKAYS